MNKLNITLSLIAALWALALSLPADAKAPKKLKPGLYAVGNENICLNKDGSWLALEKPWIGEWRSSKNVGFMYGTLRGGHGPNNIAITVSNLNNNPRYTLLIWDEDVRHKKIVVNKPFEHLGSCKKGHEAALSAVEPQKVAKPKVSISPGLYAIGDLNVCLHKDGTWVQWLGGPFYGEWGVRNGGAYIYGQRDGDISISITVDDLSAKTLTANRVSWEYYFDRDYLKIETHKRVVQRPGSCS